MSFCVAARSSDGSGVIQMSSNTVYTSQLLVSTEWFKRILLVALTRFRCTPIWVFLVCCLFFVVEV